MRKLDTGGRKSKQAGPEKEALSDTTASGDSPEKHGVLPARGQFVFKLRKLLKALVAERPTSSY